jgi:pSer/pThr/pTyr-binding forkhead associated (FHA) protein
MDVHLKTEEFIERFGSLSKKRFLDQFREPFLLLEMRGRKKSEGFSAYARTSTSKGPTLPAVKVMDTVIDSLTVPLEKSERNTFENSITVGRDQSNDVVLPHRSVSKFHAVIRKDPATGSLSIWDLGSLNGTTANGRYLPEGEACALESGMTIVFGQSVQGTFFSPEEFFDYVRLMIRLKSAREEGAK